MKGSSTGAGAEPKKPALPIDIHYNKLLDWLIDRRHCNVNWATDAGDKLPFYSGKMFIRFLSKRISWKRLDFFSVVVRGKINAAVSLPLDDIPENERLTSLLAIPHLNYFHVHEIVELLSVSVRNLRFGIYMDAVKPINSIL